MESMWACLKLVIQKPFQHFQNCLWIDSIFRHLKITVVGYSRSHSTSHYIPVISIVGIDPIVDDTWIWGLNFPWGQGAGTFVHL